MEGPKILFLDIETAPVLGWSWQFYDTNLVDIYRDWSILSCAWMWDGEKEVSVMSIHRPRNLLDFITNPENDRDLVKRLWSFLDRADFVVAHNGQSFDVKKIQSRFLHYGLTPTSPVKVIDTLKETKRISNNTRNNQDALLKSWGLGKKMEHDGWPMWLGCMSGEKDRWTQMLSYNKQDVVGLCAIYERLRPWLKESAGIFHEKLVCPKPGCGSNNIARRGYYRGRTTVYPRIQCNDCFGWSTLHINMRDLKPLTSI